MSERRQKPRDGANGDVRLECYELIRTCMKTKLLAYYATHPDRLGDERGQQAIAESMSGLECIFVVLDRYGITRLNGTDKV